MHTLAFRKLDLKFILLETHTHTHSLATLQWITGKTFSILVWWETVYVLYVCLCTGWLHICYLVWRLKNLFFLGLVLRKPIDYDYFINTCLLEIFLSLPFPFGFSIRFDVGDVFLEVLAPFSDFNCCLNVDVSSFLLELFIPYRFR